MKKIFCLWVLLLLNSCNENNDKPYSFYYWRTNLSFNSIEAAALEKANTPYLYTRFFDIEKVILSQKKEKHHNEGGNTR